MRLLKSFVNTAAEVLGFVELSLHSLQPSSSSAGTNTNTSSAALASLLDYVDVRDARYAMMQLRRRTPFEDELPHPSWPAQEDTYLNEVLIKYATDVSGSPRSVKGPSSPALLWSPANVAGQISLLWVMHLRSLCALRGVKPSQVLGEALQKRMRALGDAYAANTAREEGDTAAQLSAKKVRIVVYFLAIWNFGRA